LMLKPRSPHLGHTCDFLFYKKDTTICNCSHSFQYRLLGSSLFLEYFFLPILLPQLRWDSQGQLPHTHPNLLRPVLHIPEAPAPHSPTILDITCWVSTPPPPILSGLVRWGPANLWGQGTKDVHIIPLTL
jgi:hypothetical protein